MKVLQNFNDLELGLTLEKTSNAFKKTFLKFMQLFSILINIYLCSNSQTYLLNSTDTEMYKDYFLFT